MVGIVESEPAFWEKCLQWSRIDRGQGLVQRLADGRKVGGGVDRGGANGIDKKTSEEIRWNRRPIGGHNKDMRLKKNREEASLYGLEGEGLEGMGQGITSVKGYGL